MEKIFEWLTLTIGGIVGWVVGRFEPAFPLIVIATLFVLYDAWSAYELDKRVHIMYPKQKREKAKFMSYKFRQVIPTLIERFVIILLAYCVERWVFVHISVPVSYIAAGVVCAEQMLSIAENKASCRLPGDKHAMIWKLLAKVLIDKTARHFDIDNSILEEGLRDIEKTAARTPQECTEGAEALAKTPAECTDGAEALSKTPQECTDGAEALSRTTAEGTENKPDANEIEPLKKEDM